MNSQTGINIKLIKIWLVDDHLVYRESFKNLIESFDPAFKIIKQLENGMETKEMLKMFYHTELKPDIILMVMELDVYDGYWFLQYVMPQYPDLKILALTNKSDSLTKSRISKISVRGCITKQTKVEDLKTAVLTIVSGGTYFSQNQNSNYDEIDSELFSNFTKRELEFIDLSKTTLSYQEIAIKMSVDYSTVNFHRSNVFRKLKIKTRSELVDLISKSNG